MKAVTGLLTAALALGTVGALAQDTKSPDSQQQQHNQNLPPDQATQPGATKQEPSAAANHPRKHKRKTTHDTSK